MKRPRIQTLRDPQQRPAQGLRGAIRRMAVVATEGALWGVRGGEDAAGNVEADELEVFGSAGVRSRPAGRPEAIVVAVGGRGHAVIVATRDRAMAAGGELGADEVVIETSRAFIKITAAGEVLIGRPDGAFERVATESHVHGPGVYTNGGGALAGFSGKAVVNPGTTPGETELGGGGLSSVARAEVDLF